MSLALGAGHFGGEPLLGKATVIEASQGINHSEVAEKVRMALFLSELPAKSLDENSLRDHIGVKNDDESDQAKDNVNRVDLEEDPHTATHGWKTIGDDCED